VKLPRLSKFPRFSWRKPAPRPAFVWRWIYPLVLIGFIFAAGTLAEAGLRNALKIKDGKVTHSVTDPTQPGFLAEVVPTPTLLIVETNASNEAVGVTAMSLSADNKGGWVLQLPVETRNKDGKLLWQIWQDAVSPPPPTTSVPTGTASASTTRATTTTRAAATSASTTTIAPLSAESLAAGKTAMGHAVGQFLGFAFPTDVVVLPTKTLGQLMTSAMPINYSLQTAVQVDLPNGSQKTLFSAGPVKIQSQNDVVQLFETVGRIESPQLRLKRQADMWTAWIDALNGAPTALAGLKSDPPTLVTFLTALATGPTQYRTLPITSEGTFAGFYILEPETAATAALALQMVPFPLMVDPGARLRTALYNGTVNHDLTLAAANRMVENGAQIDVLGNATTLDVASSEIVYYDSQMKTRVETFGRSLGIDKVRLLEGESAVDVTVTLGADFKG